MTILDYGDFSINGTVISYEGAIEIEDGSKTRVFNPQVGGQQIITTDISTNKSKIMVTVRVTPTSNDQFDDFYDNGDNNTITFRQKNFTSCAMEVKPSRKDLDVTTYTFFGSPAV